MDMQQTQEDAVTGTVGMRRITGRSGARTLIGRTGGRFGLLLAILALALVGGAVVRSAAPATAAGEYVVLCENADGGGTCKTFTQDTPDLRTLSFNDRASYAWVKYGQIALYTDINYRGRCQPLWGEIKTPLASTWVGNDTVSSVRMGDCLPTDNNGAKIWTFYGFVSGSGPYIGDVKVITGGSTSISCGDGWEKALDMKTNTARDLNYHAGGDFVYLCIRRNSIPVFSFIYAVAGSTSDVACNSGDYKVPGDLNKGAGGMFIYFCVSRNFQRMQGAIPPQPQGGLADVGIYVGKRSDATAYCSRWKVGGYTDLSDVDLNSATTTAGLLSTSSQPIYACSWYVP